MDVPSVTIGNSLYLVAQVEGGLLALGDIHAAMGLGEVFGTAIEIGSQVTITIDVIKKQPLFINPLIETQSHFEIVDSSTDIINSIKTLTKLAIKLIMELNNVSFEDAYACVGSACDMKIAQVVNPNYTTVVSIPKAILHTQRLY